MYTLRTRFAKDIVCEFLPPARVTKKQRVIIFADGMPSVPSKKSLLEFFSKKGFWVFHPRYRGTWESDGKFLAKSPHLDIKDVIDGLEKPFKDLWSSKVIKLKADNIFLIGTSFGGPSSIFLTDDKRVTKSIAISSLVNWQNTGRDEPIAKLIKFTAGAFGDGYRISKNGWQKIKQGKFYNPVKYSGRIDGSKILFIHAKDDSVCRYSETKKFAKMINSKLITVNKGGHIGSSILMEPRFYKIFTKFINSK
ncbi:MAG TPA: prolyl oligopeptidase family serine peptidase [Candidatus Doudnabacteria bacterium]|nr:prolyl oligopeptidase family serine peptidase [Candidatus Doudnabacteria bacterium]